MKSKKDIFDLFKENQHKLDERPSSRAWDRLDRRLDAHHSQNKSSLYRQLAMAAAIVALVSMAFVISLTLNQSESNVMANNDNTNHPLALEELTTTDTKKNIYKISEFQLRQHDRLSNPIEEGDRSKKLRVKEAVYIAYQERTINNRNKSDRLIAAQNKPTNSSPELLADATINKSKTASSYNIEIGEEEPPSNLADVVEAVEENIPAENTYAEAAGATSTQDLDNTYVESEKDFTEESFEDGEELAQIEEVYAVEEDKVMVQSAPVPARASAKKESASYDEADYGNADAILNTQSNVVTYSSKNSNSNSVNQFNWMLGNWKNKNSNALSVETWKQRDEFTIEGKGYLLVNGDTTFTERMQIKKIGDDLYYILALDEDQQSYKFKLKTYTNEKAIFENDAVDFPNQLILTNNNNLNFSTLMQNKEATQLNLSQQNYFSNRNIIQQEQVLRVLDRVEE